VENTIHSLQLLANYGNMVIKHRDRENE